MIRRLLLIMMVAVCSCIYAVEMTLTLQVTPENAGDVERIPIPGVGPGYTQKTIEGGKFAFSVPVYNGIMLVSWGNMQQPKNVKNLKNKLKPCWQEVK